MKDKSIRSNIPPGVRKVNCCQLCDYYFVNAHQKITATEFMKMNLTKEEKLDARISQDEIEHVYDRLAGIYDIWGRLTESRARNRAIELAEIQDGQNILEVAVGTGLAFYEIAKRNPSGKNIGIDLSKGMLEKAKYRLTKLAHTNYSLNTGTAFALNIADESIDVLINKYMFDLIPFNDMDKLLTEFKRVLRKQGKLILVNMIEGERFGFRLAIS